MSWRVQGGVQEKKKKNGGRDGGVDDVLYCPVLSSPVARRRSFNTITLRKRTKTGGEPEQIDRPTHRRVSSIVYQLRKKHAQSGQRNTLLSTPRRRRDRQGDKKKKVIVITENGNGNNSNRTQPTTCRNNLAQDPPDRLWRVPQGRCTPFSARGPRPQSPSPGSFGFPKKANITEIRICIISTLSKPGLTVPR